MIVVRNYSRFLVGTTENPVWEDMKQHRFPTDFDRLLKFETTDEAQKVLDDHPHLEDEFDAWFEDHERNQWTGTIVVTSVSD